MSRVRLFACAALAVALSACGSAPKRDLDRERIEAMMRARRTRPLTAEARALAGAGGCYQN